MERNKRSIKLIKLYQKNKRVSGRCHFIPSCSNYAIEAYSKFNWFYATILTAFRIIRCTPFTKRRIDLVPLNKEEKRKKKELENLKTKYDNVYIDLILKQNLLHYPMNNSDFYLLTLEYLFGYNYYSKSETTIFEQLGFNYLRVSGTFPIQPKCIDEELLQQYLDILLILNDYGFINYKQEEFTTPSNNSPHNYQVVSPHTLPLNFWIDQIKSFCAGEQFIIGIENGSTDDIYYLARALKAQIITVDELLKTKNNMPNAKLIVTGSNLSNPQISYYLSCLIYFYENDKLDINKYNFVIPKYRK